MATWDKAGLTLTRRWRTTAVSPWHRRLTRFAAFFMVAMPGDHKQSASLWHAAICANLAR